MIATLTVDDGLPVTHRASGLTALVDPAHPALAQLRTALAGKLDPASVGQIAHGFLACNGGAVDAVSVLERGKGNCLGLSALIVSTLLGLPQFEEQDVWVAVVVQPGSVGSHAVVVYHAIPTSSWGMVDPGGAMQPTIIPQALDPRFDALPWQAFGGPSDGRVRLLFNHRRILITESRGSGTGT